MIEKVEDCQCAFCGNDLDFELDEFLESEILNGNAVVFAGAGISTETANTAPSSLYSQIIHEIGVEYNNIAFPDAVQKFVSKPDGATSFIRLIEDHFENIDKFSDLRRAAQRFFYELRTIPSLNEYVTTNWDRHFEDICFAKPFVYDADMHFWDVPRRKVLKIHGTIDNYSTLVASRDEYDKSLDSLQVSLVGGKLKEILSKKTCIFVGYSMRDDDFSEIFRFVQEVQGKFVKTHYFISPFADKENIPENVIPIKTDGTYFFRCLKDHMEASDCIVPDDMFARISEELDEVFRSHNLTWEKYNPRKFPQALPSALYQDGLIHGYQMILDRVGTGKFSHTCEIIAVVRQYEEMIAGYRSNRRYLQVAYFRGYQNALLSLGLSGQSNDFKAAPHFFYNGIEEMDRDHFIDAFEELPEVHKLAFRQSQAKLRKFASNEDLVIQMMPWAVY